MASQPLKHVLSHLRQLVRPLEACAGTDRELLQRFVHQHDEAAFAALLRRHGPLVLGVCRRMLGDAHAADDAFQATFLVLIRKADSIPWQDTVGSWLYQVAYRTALKARASAAHRQLKEREAGQMRPTPMADEPAGRDLQAVLDEEVQRLPAKYRLPVVLCCVEGLSKTEAARQLEWKEGTLASRLARARELLRRRLTRRGLDVSAGSLAVALTPASLTAAVSTVLEENTLQAAVVAANVSAPVAALVEGVVRTMWLSKLKTVAMLVLVVGVLGSGGGWAIYQAASGERSQPSGPEQASAALTTPADLDPKRREGADSYGDPLPPGARARLGTLRLRHGMPMTSIAISADSKTLVTAGNDDVIRLHDLASGRAIGELQGATPVRKGKRFAGRKLALSSQTLAVTGVDVIELWDLATRKKRRELQAFEGNELYIQSVAFSPDGKTLVAGIGHHIRLWAVDSGELKLRFPVDSNRPNMEVRNVVFSPDGKTLAGIVLEPFAIQLWHATTGKEVRRFPDQPGEMFAIAFSPDGKSLASADYEGKFLSLWEVATGKERIQFQDSSGAVKWVQSIAFSPDGKTLASAGRLFDVATGKLLREGPRYPGLIKQDAFSPDGKLLAYADRSSVQLWDVEQAKEHSQIHGHKGGVSAVFSSDGKRLATFDHSAITRLWDTVNGKELQRLEFGPVYGRRLSPDFKTVASTDRNQLQFWDAGTGKELKQHVLGKFMHLASAGKTLISVAERDLRLWDWATRTELQRFELPQAIAPLALSTDGKTLAAADDGNSPRAVRLWDLATGKEIRQLQGPPNIRHVIVFSPNGQLLVWGNFNNDGGTVGLYETATGKQLRQLPKATTWLAACFSPDSKTLAFAHQGERTIALWDVARWQPVGELAGHLGDISSLAFSIDGQTLASGSEDTTVLLWDMSQFLGK